MQKEETLYVSILTLIVAALIFFIGLIVLLRNPEKKANKLFFHFCASLCIWISATVFEGIVEDYYLAKLAVILDYSSGAVIAYWFLIFILNFPITQKDTSKRDLIFAIPTGLFVIATLLSLTVKDININGRGVDIHTGPLYIPYVLYVFTYVIYGLVSLVNKHREAKGLLKAQTFYLLVGFSLSAIITLMTSLVLPRLFNSPEIFNYGIFSFLIFVVSTAYTIITHQLFDIRIIIRRTVVYSGLLLFTLATYSAVIFSFATVFGEGEAINTKSFIANLIAAMMIAFGFEPIKQYLTRITDQYLFKGSYNQQAILSKLSYELSSSIDVRQASQSLVMLIKSEMRLARAAVITFANEEDQVILKEIIQDGYPNPTILQLPSDNLLLHYYSGEPKILITETIRQECAQTKSNSEINNYKAILADLEKLGAAVIVPIVIGQKTIGIFIVGDKLSGDVFTVDEVQFLVILANQTANTIQKSRFWEEDQMKTEFVSIASHELLTPTAAMKGYLSMILDDNMGQVDDTARRYLTKVAYSADRLANLVEDLLNVSRIESGRVKINKREFSLLETVNRVVEELQVNARKKSINLSLIAAEGSLPNVYADPDHIYRVLVNLIGNAIKYTNQGWVRVSITQYNDQSLLFAVSDSGVGIPKDSIAHLFEKFYRAERKEINGIQGTGLGLYISKKIIDLMGGQMWAESESGKGSVFYFTLPTIPQATSVTPTNTVASPAQPQPEPPVVPSHVNASTPSQATPSPS